MLTQAVIKSRPKTKLSNLLVILASAAAASLLATICYLYLDQLLLLWADTTSFISGPSRLARPINSTRLDPNPRIASDAAIAVSRGSTVSQPAAFNRQNAMLRPAAAAAATRIAGLAPIAAQAATQLTAPAAIPAATSTAPPTDNDPVTDLPRLQGFARALNPDLFSPWIEPPSSSSLVWEPAPGHLNACWLGASDGGGAGAKRELSCLPGLLLLGGFHTGADGLSQTLRSLPGMLTVGHLNRTRMIYYTCTAGRSWVDVCMHASAIVCMHAHQISAYSNQPPIG